jgi:hypothetical protein
VSSLLLVVKGCVASGIGGNEAERASAAEGINSFATWKVERRKLSRQGSVCYTVDTQGEAKNVRKSESNRSTSCTVQRADLRYFSVAVQVGTRMLIVAVDIVEQTRVVSDQPGEEREDGAVPSEVCVSLRDSGMQLGAPVAALGVARPCTSADWDSTGRGEKRRQA